MKQGELFPPFSTKGNWPMKMGLRDVNKFLLRILIFLILSKTDSPLSSLNLNLLL